MITAFFVFVTVSLFVAVTAQAAAESVSSTRDFA
jgi:hypothetical protein